MAFQALSEDTQKRLRNNKSVYKWLKSYLDKYDYNQLSDIDHCINKTDFVPYLFN